MTTSPLTRRAFLASVTSAALIVGFNPRNRSWITRTEAAQPGWDQLPKLDGALLLDETSRNALATDGGQYFHRVPLAVLRPLSNEDIVKTVQFANAHKLKVAVRGQGHSQYGQTLVEGGIVIDSSTLNAVKMPAPGTVDTQAGATWNHVTRVTLAKGLTPPAMGNTMTLSVGGILSVGGWSNSSHLYGSVADTVQELDVVTGDGRLGTCSRQRDAELFDMVLAGMGQCALIVGARIRLVSAPGFVTRRNLVYDDLKAALADGKQLTARGTCEHLSCTAIRERDGAWSFAIEVGKFHDSSSPVAWDVLTAGLKFKSASTPTTASYADYLQREAASNATIREARKKNPVHAAFLTMFIPASAADDFLARILATPQETAGAFRIAPVMFDTRKFGRPMFKLPGEDITLVLWMFRTVRKGDVAGYTALMETNRAMLERMRAAGGKAYPPQVPYSSRAEWEEHYGPDTWRRLLTAKKTYDPNGILTPGPGMFVAKS